MGEQAAFDRMADALSHPYRRQLLVALTEHNPQQVEAGLDAKNALASVNDGEIAGGTAEMELIHNHLPKLDIYRYITRDEATGAISKGPHWEEIEPLLRLLRTHEDELPSDWLACPRHEITD